MLPFSLKSTGFCAGSVLFLARMRKMPKARMRAISAAGDVSFLIMSPCYRAQGKAKTHVLHATATVLFDLPQQAGRRCEKKMLIAFILETSGLLSPYIDPKCSEPSQNGRSLRVEMAHFAQYAVVAMYRGIAGNDRRNGAHSPPS
jgi:hypothetical protein